MVPDKNLKWSDEEINFLLHVVIDYKQEKQGLGEGVDWETVRRKCKEVTKMFTAKVQLIRIDNLLLFVPFVLNLTKRNKMSHFC